MLKRKFMDKLIEWKKSKKNECLLVKGARQIGKTYIIEKFGIENYKSFIKINFLERPDLKAVFSNNLSADEIYKKISLFLKNINFIEKDTLIFLDEIQECPEARAALKFLAIDNKYDVIASGSLLGINYKDVPSIPVGYEKQIEMFSLDFEEFLWAIGIKDEVIDYLKDFFDDRKKVPDEINEQMMKYLREYMVIGGMPEVVNAYVTKKNFNEVDMVQNKILNSYLEDIAKYAPISEKPKARNCYLSIPKQLAKENKKFQFSTVENRGRARKYENSLEWLRDANLIKFCLNVSTPMFPLIAYERSDQFKIYINDIGLLTAMYGFEMKATIINNSLLGSVKGGIYENLISDILVKKGYRLNYFKTNNSSQEIEFLISKEGKVIPIEVKAGNNPSISLDNYILEYKPLIAYKFVSGNIGVSNVKITMPLYMAMFL